jgi:hypothetical protein
VPGQLRYADGGPAAFSGRRLEFHEFFGSYLAYLTAMKNDILSGSCSSLQIRVLDERRKTQ